MMLVIGAPFVLTIMENDSVPIVLEIVPIQKGTEIFRRVKSAETVIRR